MWKRYVLVGRYLGQLSIHRVEDFVSSNNSLVNLTLTPPRTKTYRLAYLSCDWKSVNAFNSTACLVDWLHRKNERIHKSPPHQGNSERWSSAGG